MVGSIEMSGEGFINTVGPYKRKMLPNISEWRRPVKYVVKMNLLEPVKRMQSEICTVGHNRNT